jgi:hypothetical protein
MKELLKIVIVLVGSVVLAITGLFYLAAGMMTGVADEFFAAIGKQDIAAAHSYLTEDFKASTDEAALKQFLTTQALLGFEQTDWSDRHIASGLGQLDGAVITGNGAVPLKLMFLKEGGAWKINAIRLQSEETSAGLPLRMAQVALVKRAMVDFAISIRDADMKHFYSTLSRRWQRHTTPEKLGEAFADTMSKRLDLTVLEDLQPVIEPILELDEDGGVTLEGYFPTSPNRVNFEQAYVYEGLEWKLIAFGLSIRPPEEAGKIKT